MPDVSRQEAAAEGSTSRLRPRTNANAVASSSSLLSAHKLHRPYRIQVQDVTPVSIALLWSLRPPPIAPEELKRGSRHRLALAAGQSTSAPDALTDDAGDGRGDSDDDHDDSDDYDEEDEDDWPSDDGATAVDQSSDRDDSGAEDGQRDAATTSTSHRNGSGNAFPSGISVSVNGIPWTHVVLGDRGNDEAVVVIYGLLPSHEYNIELSVGRGEGALTTLSARAVTDAEVTAGGINSSLADPALSASGAAVATSAPSAVHTPEHSRSSSLAAALSLPGASTGTSSPTLARVLASSSLEGAEAGALLSSLPESGSSVGPVAGATQDRAARLQAEGAALAALRESLTSELRKARKEASRAESTLRNEIEAIKRGLERMSGADHRSKQKVLALQESIRQATLHTKELDEEADEAEKERPKWEDKEAEATRAWEVVRDDVEAKERDVEQAVKEDKDELDEREKELEKLKDRIAAKEAERDRLRDEDLARLEEQLAKLQAETESARKQPVPKEMLRSVELSHHMQLQQIQQHSAPHHGQHGYAPGGAGGQIPFVPSQVRGRGRGSTRGARATGGAFHRGRGRNTHASGGFAPHGAHAGQHGAPFDPDASFGSTNDEHSTPVLSGDTFGGSQHGHHHHVALNPYNPEFVPSGVNTANASPVLSKTTRGSGDGGRSLVGAGAGGGGAAIGLGMGPPPSARLGFSTTDPRAPHRAASGPSAFADSSSMAPPASAAPSLAPIGASRSAHNSPLLGHNHVAGLGPGLTAPGQIGSNAPSPNLLHRQAFGVGVGVGVPALDFASADGGYRRGSLGPASPTRLSPAGGAAPGGSNSTSPIGVPPVPPAGTTGVWSSASPVSSPWHGTVALPHVGGPGAGGGDIWSSSPSQMPQQATPHQSPPIGTSPSSSVAGHGASSSPTATQPPSGGNAGGAAPGLRLVQQQHQHGLRHKPSFPSALSGQRRGANRVGSGAEGVTAGAPQATVTAGVIGGENAMRSGSAPVSPVTSNAGGGHEGGVGKGSGAPMSPPLIIPPAAAAAAGMASASSSPTQAHPSSQGNLAAATQAVAQGTATANRQSPGPLSFASVAAMRDAEGRREASV